jgi:CheY-like chemotaxis protein
LPRWTEGIESEPVSESETSEVRRGRILIVDDEIAIAEILASLLENEHDVGMVASGDEALELAIPGKYDVALLDLGMPGMAGDALAFQLIQIDPNLVLVMTTGWKLDEDDSRLIGFDFWIQKPFRGLDRVRDLVTRGIHLHDERTSQ